MTLRRRVVGAASEDLTTPRPAQSYAGTKSLLSILLALSTGPDAGTAQPLAAANVRQQSQTLSLRPTLDR